MDSTILETSKEGFC